MSEIFHKRRFCSKTFQVSCGIHTFNRKAFFTCNLLVKCGIQQKKHVFVEACFCSCSYIFLYKPYPCFLPKPTNKAWDPSPTTGRLALVEYASSRCWRGPRCSNVVSKGFHWERSSACYSPRGSGSGSFDTGKITPLRKATRFEGMKNSAVKDSYQYTCIA